MACAVRQERARESATQASPDRSRPSTSYGKASPVLAPAPACACGGICPRCRAAGAWLPVGEAGDAEEARAEAVARRFSGGWVQTGPGRPSPISRVAGDSAVLRALDAPGRRLDSAEQRDLRHLPGMDPEAATLHAGPEADAGARALDTLAYSWGRHVVFSSRASALPPPARGHLLAHEVAHGAAFGGVLRRAGYDWLIEDLPPDAATDLTSLYFQRGGTTLPPSETTKIPALATPPAQNLTLHGFASEDASAADRTTVITARLNAVDAALQAAGHTGTRTQVPHRDAGVGDPDYRHKRIVQVLPTPSGLASAPTTVNQCGAAGSEVATGAVLTSCNSAFGAAFPTAVAVVNRAEQDIVTTPTAAATAIVNRFFSGVPRADVDANVTAIAAQVRQLNTAHRCHTECDGGCDRPAYNEGTGLGAGGAMMTLCPDFATAPADFQVNTLIHESAHANPVESIEDIAYSNTRLIPFLLAADSRRNTDSYVLLMRLVHTAGSMVPGPAAADTLSGMTGAGAGSDTEQSQRSVAWLESWLNYGDFDTGLAYNDINTALGAGSWSAAGINEFNIETVHRLATAFSPDITDPGVDGAPRSILPSEADKQRVAAIHDRFDQLYDVVNQNPITITRGAPGSTDVWSGNLVMPYLNRSVTLSPGFFALSTHDQVRRLTRLMVQAHLGISGGFESKYVEALDLIHAHRGLGP